MNIIARFDEPRMVNVMARPTVFISYSHKDEIWKDLIVKHLCPLEEKGVIVTWNDRQIAGGDDWFLEIQKALSSASIAVLIVSPDFLQSDFIHSEEVPLLLTRHAKQGVRIFPVIAKPCDWLSVDWLSRFNARPKDGRPLSTVDQVEAEADLVNIAQEINTLLEYSGIRPQVPRFVPLPPDRIALARLPSTSVQLFGRKEELSFLDKCWEDPEVNVITSVGAGGSGKTALVNSWLNELEANRYRGARLVFAFSFYGQGTSEKAQASADLFLSSALSWFGDPNPDEGSSWSKGERLAELVKKTRSLIVLDGLEPLQFHLGESTWEI